MFLYSPSGAEPSDMVPLVSGAELSVGAGGASLGSSGLGSATAGSGDTAFRGSFTTTVKKKILKMAFWQMKTRVNNPSRS